MRIIIPNIRLSGSKACTAVFLWVCILFTAANVYSMQFNISGRVTADSLAITWASVTLIDQDNPDVQYTTITDTAGYFQLGVATGVYGQPPVIPKDMELLQNYPNPFSSGTVIAYRLHKPGPVSMTIYDVLGRQVRSFTTVQQSIGTHNVSWDGRDHAGARVAAGIYFYRINAGGQVVSGKMLCTGKGIPVQRISSPAAPAINNRAVRHTFDETRYTLKIENRDDTMPRIQELEINDVSVHTDTMLDLSAETLENWRLLGLANEFIMNIAVDPVDPNILYAGSRTVSGDGYDAKLFKSTDGGATWDTLLAGGYNPYSWEIMIDPTDHNTIYVTHEDLLRSEDGGQTWTDMDANKTACIRYMAMNPKNPNVLYAGCYGGIWGDSGSLHKSCDGGETWFDTGPDSLFEGVSFIGIDPVDTNNVYAGIVRSRSLCKSTDAGKNWSSTGLRTGSFTYDMLFEVLPQPEIYVGTSGIFKSSDGLEWENISYGYPIADRNVKEIEKSTTGRLFICATSNKGGGIYEFSNHHQRWVRIGIDIENATFGDFYGDMALSLNSDKLYFGGYGLYVLDLQR